MTTFLDLFAGCGGMSIGLNRAGLTSIGEVELDSWAADSLRHNFPESRVIQGDIRDLGDDVIRSFAGVDVIVGGPPCQGFSVAGASQFGVVDPRNDLIYWFIHWVRRLRPRIALIENVPNILTRTKSGFTVLDTVSAELKSFGYAVDARVLNAADFGTPQLRRRAFIVATAPSVTFKFPEATHGGECDLFADRAAYITVVEAISDLPLIEAGEGTDNPVPYSTPPLNAYQKEARQGSSYVTNHIAMKHTNRVVERFKVIQAGQSLKDVPLEHGQKAYFTGETVKNPFKYNNYRLDPAKPSLAIPASFQSLFVHPTRHRNLTAREAARLMGFPDAFEFKGKRTTMSWEKNLSQYNQIGNAVCPPLAKALGQAISRALYGSSPRTPSASVLVKRSPTSPKLAGRTPLPSVRSVVGSAVEPELMEIGSQLLGRGGTEFRRQGFSVPTTTLTAALIFAADRTCPVCSPGLAPFSSHLDEMAFLISKEDLQSLRENEQDHGLDYHLRATLDIPHQVAHVVGEELAALGLVELVLFTNPRTGRRVRGMRSNGWAPPGGLTERLRSVITGSAEPLENAG